MFSGVSRGRAAEIDASSTQSLRLLRVPPRMSPLGEAPMPFTIRQYLLFSACCFVTHNVGPLGLHQKIVPAIFSTSQ